MVEAYNVDLKNMEMKSFDLKNLDMKQIDDSDGRDKAYWIQRVGEVSQNVE